MEGCSTASDLQLQNICLHSCCRFVSQRTSLMWPNTADDDLRRRPTDRPPHVADSSSMMSDSCTTIRTSTHHRVILTIRSVSAVLHALTACMLKAQTYDIDMSYFSRERARSRTHSNRLMPCVRVSLSYTSCISPTKISFWCFAAHILGHSE